VAIRLENVRVEFDDELLIIDEEYRSYLTTSEFRGRLS